MFGDKKLKENKTGYAHVNLFSGVGGIDLGFRAAGFRTVRANDIDSDICDTFRKNLGEIVEGDIRTVGFPKRRLTEWSTSFVDRTALLEYAHE